MLVSYSVSGIYFMVVSASLVSSQRPFSCHPSSPFLVIPVLDTGI
ncbi:hypothetical protein [Wolbachia endosymbiont of Nasonia vitripennis]